MTQTRRRRGHLTARRWGVAGWATAGMAAAAAAVLVLAPDKFGGEVPAANAQAAQVLNNAAAAALKLPDVEPRPDQFVYTKSQQGGSPREIWQSVDGTRDGLVQQAHAGDVEKIPLPGCREERAAVVKGDRVDPRRTEPCTPQPAYLPDLPTDVDSMPEYLNKNHSREAGDANAMGKDVLALIGENHLRPQSQAALFQVAARIPGIRAVPDVKDGAGRPGIGIAWSSQGKSGMLVFDVDTYAFLGVADASATLAVALVDKAGQRP
ncbi:CU044_5270 family protein [Micromonospora sp. CB01531]|uniref:CU044_5270 family protein n=1 Tax=Micromonospora sp. CB01531 TaxID=1718947 RepID=UPI0018E953D5|nr:CU044_5270 family protein [Micromonospora sp. CB01531]